MIATEKKWGLWVTNILLVLGISFLLTGIIFFFAFNWQNMTPLHKFIAIEAGILICILGAIIYSNQTPFSSIYLTGASILVGVFLAVFGQIYQTGADTFQLFATWAILIFPWVFIAQFTPLWFIWIIIFNFALIFFLKSTSYFYIPLLILNTAILLIKEHSHWLQGRWPRISIALFVIFLAFFPIENFFSSILSTSGSLKTEPLLYYSAGIGVLTLISLIYTYGFYLSDMWVVALTSFQISILLCILTMKTLNYFEIEELLKYFVMLLVIFFVFTVTAYFLILLGKKHSSKG